MTDGTLSAWAALAVGHQLPATQTLTVLEATASQRQLVAASFEAYADLLQTVLRDSLSNQEGATADESRKAFEAGAAHASIISERQRTIQKSYLSAFSATCELREKLLEIANDTEEQIEAITSSKESRETKVARITSAVVSAQQLANVQAAAHSGDVLSAIQNVLRSQDSPLSAAQFATMAGIVLEKAYTSPDIRSVQSSVHQLFGNDVSSPSRELNGYSTRPLSGDPAENEGKPDRISESASLGETAHSTSDIYPYEQSSPRQLQSQLAHSAEQFPTTRMEAGNRHVPVSTSVGDPGTGTTIRGSNALALPSCQTQNADSCTAAPLGTLAQGESSAASGLHGRLNSSYDTSNFHAAGSSSNSDQFSTPSEGAAVTRAPHPEITAGIEALLTNASATFHPPLAEALTPLHEAASAGAPVFEAAHAPPVTETTAPAVPADTAPSQPVIAPAVPPAAAPVATPPGFGPAVPAGGLLGYGADLRPATPVIPSAPPLAPATAPSSAPVGAGQPTVGQPAVMRQSTVSAQGAALTERAFTATAAGAAGGKSAAESAAGARLRRLLDAVARQ